MELFWVQVCIVYYGTRGSDFVKKLDLCHVFLRSLLRAHVRTFICRMLSPVKLLFARGRVIYYIRLLYYIEIGDIY